MTYILPYGTNRTKHSGYTPTIPYRLKEKSLYFRKQIKSNPNRKKD